jgi:uncharacterized DUF497 family protein
MYQFNIEFEYNEEKSEANRLKHGFSLEEAKILWVQLSAEWPVPYPDEKRWLRVGMFGDKFYTCIFTYRGLKTRLISLRRSRKEEVNRYYREMSKDEKEKT